MTVDWIPADNRTIALEHAVADVMNIQAVSVRGSGDAVYFRGQFLRSPELVYAHIADTFKAHQAQALLRQEEGVDYVIAFPAQAVGKRSRLRVHVLLFVATLLSTLMAGTLQAVPDAFDQAGTFSDVVGVLARNWTAGVPFAAALLGILGVHEFGHYFVARYYKLDVSLPYFIPFPLNPLTGTLGAVIRIQSPFESRKALFDVGIAGPLAGLAIALPVVAAGLMQAKVVALSPGAQVINEPLLFQWMALLFAPGRTTGFDLEMNPLLMAGWWGFFITALNLTPVSQLDGGHVLYGLFGPAHRYIARAMFAVAATMTLLFNPSYLIMLILVFMMGIEHPPALNDLTPIGTPRKLLGIGTLLLFFLLFTPNPFP